MEKPIDSPSTDLVLLKDIESEAIELILSNFPEEMRDKIAVTPDKLRTILTYLEDQDTFGLKKRIPLLCQAEKCEFATICIWQQNGIAPEGHPCPEEMIIIDRLVPGLVRDLQVDAESPMELNMIMEYVDAEIQDIRAAKGISIKGQTVRVVSAIDQTTGTPYYEDKENPLLVIKERALKRKDKLRKDFLATREQRQKYKLRDDKDESKKQSQQRKRAEDALERSKKEIEDAKFEDVT